MRTHAYHFSAPQRERIACLRRLAADALTALDVEFTGAYLEERLIQAYLAVTARSMLTEEGEPAAVDWSDPSNLTVVLLEALRSYHVKHRLGDAESCAAGTVTLAILAGREDEPCATRLAIVRARADGARALHFADGSEAPCPGDDSTAVECWVLLQTSPYSREPALVAHRRRERMTRAGLALAGTAGVAVVASAVWQGVRNVPLMHWVPSLLLLAAGVALSWQLFLLHRVGSAANPLLRKLCAQGERGFDCHAVISSKAVRLPGGLDLVDAGAVYFASLLTLALWGLLSRDYPHALTAMLWGALAPLPMVVYLMYYQAAVLRKFCVLCLGTHVVIALHAAHLARLNWRGAVPALDGTAVAMAAAATAAAGVTYALLVRWWGLQVEMAALRAERSRVAGDLAYYDVLAGREPLAADPDLPGALVLGNPAAPMRLGAILSPLCAPCAEKLDELNRLVDWFGDEICVTVLLKAEPSGEQLARAVLQHTLAGEHRAAAALMRRWYDAANLERHEPPSRDDSWRRAEDDVEPTGVEAAFALHQQWFARQRVPHTPLLLHNERQVPQPFWDTERLIGILEQRQEQLAG